MSDARDDSFEVERTLLACLHRDPAVLAASPLPAPDSPRWDALLALATTQRVRPLLHRRLRALEDPNAVPAHVLATLDQAARATAIRNLRFHAEIAAISHALTPLGIHTLALKGAHLSAVVYDQIGLREMSDIDLLVRREHLAAAVEVLTARGYRPLQAFSIDLDTAFHHHLTKFVKKGVAGIELHWTLTVPTERQHIEPGPLWARAQTLAMGGAPVFGLSNEDLLLHLCHHASYGHRFRRGLRPVCDIAALTAKPDVSIDWGVAARRAREWGWDAGVALIWRLAADLGSAPIPSAALAALAPNGLDPELVAAARAQLFDEASPEGLEPGVAQLASDDSLVTRLRHLARRVAPPRRELARLYGHSESSPRIAFGYARRAWDLARRHGLPAARLLLSRDTRLTDSAARTERLRRWLS